MVQIIDSFYFSAFAAEGSKPDAIVSSSAATVKVYTTRSNIFMSYN
jgi:hypothetical protein